MIKSSNIQVDISGGRCGLVCCGSGRSAELSTALTPVHATVNQDWPPPSLSPLNASRTLSTRHASSVASTLSLLEMVALVLGCGAQRPPLFFWSARTLSIGVLAVASQRMRRQRALNRPLTKHSLGASRQPQSAQRSRGRPTPTMSGSGVHAPKGRRCRRHSRRTTAT